MASRKRWLSREVIVAAWLILAYGFLWVRLPGFWRSPYQRFQQAQRLDAAGQTADAASELSMAVDEEPQNAGYLVALGHLQLKLDRDAEADRTFSRALEVGPNPEASLGLAAAVVARPVDAERALDELDLEDLSREQRFRRLSLYASAGAFQKALSDQSLLAQLTAPAEQREALRWAMAAQDWLRAIELAEMVERGSTDASVIAAVRHERAVALRAAGRFEEALALFAIDPGPATLVERAQLSLQLERFPQAASAYREIVAQAPDDVEARMALAYALEKSGQMAAAAAVYRTAVDERGAEARIKLATLLNSLQRFDDAWLALLPLERPSPDTETLRLQARTALWAKELTAATPLFAALGARRTAADRAYEADLAKSLGEAGRNTESDRVFERLLAEDALSREGRLAFADALTARQRFDDAWRVLQGVAPADDDLLGRRARVAFWSRNFATALPLLRAWLARHSGDAERWADAAEAARQLADAEAESSALATYLELRPADRVATMRRARLLEQSGQLDQALVVYRQALEREPNRLDLARTIGYLSEQGGNRADAIRYYTRAWELSEPRDAELALTIARLLRPDAPGEALDWFARAGSGALGAVERRQLQLEQARNELAAKRVDQASARLAALLREDPANADALVVAARMETDRGSAGAAVGHLRRLSEVRTLTLDERRWFGGQLRSAGDAAGALAQFEQIAGTAGGVTAPDLEAVGDLRAQAGNINGALEAYARARSLGAPASTELAFARLLASTGRFTEAVDAYTRYLTTGSPDGKRVELARAHLAAGTFTQAERWAREATAGDERGPEAEMILAQALYLSDKRRESDAVIARLPSPLPGTARVYEQAGQLAAARDRHLTGIRWFEQAIALSPSNAGELHYWTGMSSLTRGDYARALRSLEFARTAGAVPYLERLARAEAGRATAPTIWLPVRVSGDSNGLSTRQAGGGVTFWPGYLFPLSIEAITGQLSQDNVSFGRTRAVGGVSRALVRPDFGIGGYVGAEGYDGRQGRAVGGGNATYYFDDRSTLHVDVRRDSLWSERDRRDPRQFVRAFDLSRVGPDFFVRGAEIALETSLSTLQGARVQFGRNLFQDGNAQNLFYGHYQLVVDDRPGLWTAFRPNVYWESFSQRSGAYFSPDNFFSLGGMWHSIRATPTWRFEAELNPRLTWLHGDPSYGVHGVVDLSRSFGPFSAGVGGFTFYDRRSDYWTWRLAGQVGVRVGR